MTTDNPIMTDNTAWVLTALSPALGDLSIPVSISLSIGRHTDNDVVLAVPQVSRRHAQFNQVGQHLYLQDLNSANGTFVNGQKIGNDAVAVNDNDEIGFADLLFVLSMNKPFSTSVADVENLAFADKSISSPKHATENPAPIAETVAPEKVATETVAFPPKVAPTVAKPTVTAPVEPQAISPITTTSPNLAHKNNASKNMWLIAIVIILLIAALVIAKMVL